MRAPFNTCSNIHLKGITGWKEEKPTQEQLERAKRTERMWITDVNELIEQKGADPVRF